jgi:hypothetical protein
MQSFDNCTFCTFFIRYYVYKATSTVPHPQISSWYHGYIYSLDRPHRRRILTKEIVVHPFKPVIQPSLEGSIPGTSHRDTVWLIPTMRHMRCSGSLVSISIPSTAHDASCLSNIAVWSCIAIFIQRGLVPHCGSIRGIRGPHISWGGVRRESIFVDLLNIVVVLWAALPKLSLGGTSSVTIVRGGAESTLLATVSDEAVFAGD